MKPNPEYLLKQLKGLQDDRGAMAALRKGFSKATEVRAWPYVARWCNLENDKDRTIVQFIAAAYAHHPKDAKGMDMGTVMRKIATGSDMKQNDALNTFEGRFRRLLTCQGYEDLCKLLPGVIITASKKDIGIDYVQLFNDLWYWNDNTRLHWAGSYWNVKQEGQ